MADDALDIRAPPATVAAAPHRIVVVGGGAGGLELVDPARRYARQARPRGRSRWSTGAARISGSRCCTPSPPAACDRSQHELNYLAQAHWHHFRFRLGEMVGLDRAAQADRAGAAVRRGGPRDHAAVAALAYDTLVIAVGSVTNDFGTPGAAQFAVPLETPEQAGRFNRRLVNACLQRANAGRADARPGSCMSPSSAPARRAPSLRRNCTTPRAT